MFLYYADLFFTSFLVVFGTQNLFVKFFFLFAGLLLRFYHFRLMRKRILHLVPFTHRRKRTHTQYEQINNEKLIKNYKQRISIFVYVFILLLFGVVENKTIIGWFFDIIIDKRTGQCLRTDKWRTELNKWVGIRCVCSVYECCGD